MMYEIAAARQPDIPSPRQGYRRLFAGEEFTLHVWYDRRGGEITEFHLFYGPTRAGRVSWAAGAMPAHDGRATEHGFWGTDGVVIPGSFNLQRFREASRGIDAQIRSFVLERLAEPLEGRDRAARTSRRRG